jgi:hypothetical protein
VNLYAVPVTLKEEMIALHESWKECLAALIVSSA